jgi:hypothetical protein
VNEFLAKKLSAAFEPAQALLDKVSEPLKTALQGSILSSIDSIKGMPKIMGFIEKGESGCLIWCLPLHVYIHGK